MKVGNILIGLAVLVLILSAPIGLWAVNNDSSPAATQPAQKLVVKESPQKPPAQPATAPADQTATETGSDSDKVETPATAPITVVQQQQTENGATVATLSNGMTVIVKAVHTAPVVSVRAYVRAGGLYEGKWLGCGLSHLLEHLTAKESISGEGGHIRSKRKGKRNRTEEIGGQSNAYTSFAQTCYYISAAAETVNDCIDIIADQMARPDITLEDFQREHGVVQRELEMGKDNPGRVMFYTHYANLYRTHPAAVPVIGFAGPLSKVTFEDIMAYHRKMYVPQNMVFLVVGDIDPEKALTHVVEKMQGFEKSRTPELSLPPVAPVAETRRVVRPSKLFKEISQYISFQTIPLIHKDLYPLDVLSYILSNGQSSRLVRKLQFEKRLVTSIDSYSATPAWGKGSFTVTYRAEPAKADAAEQAILDELRKVITEGVSQGELDRAKRQKIADQVRSQQTMESIAATLGSDFLSAGDVEFSQAYTDRIQKVTAEEIQEVAKKYFNFDAMVITRIGPPESCTVTQSKAEKSAAGQTEIITLPNGMKVVLCTSNAVKLVSMVLAVKGGLLLETPADNGTGMMMTALSSRGAGDMTAEQISAFFNEAGGSIGGICGDNTFIWSASVLSDRFDKAMKIFGDVIFQPTFPEKELDNLRPLAIAAIKRTDENWSSQLNKFFRKKFFNNSPWQMLTSGEIEVIKKLTPEQLQAYHAKILKGGSVVLAIYGDFDLAKTREMITDIFSKMPPGQTEPKLADQRKIKPEGEVYVLPTTTKQAGIMVAAPGTTVMNIKDRLALMLTDTIISGYNLPSGWLHTELRGKKLVYVVHAYHKAGFAPGAFITYAGTQAEKAKEVVDIIEKNLRKAADYVPSQEELDRAIKTIVTADVLNNQELGDLAVRAALNELYGLGADWSKKLRDELKKITPEQVRDVAKKYLGGGYVVTVITPKPELFPEESVEK